MKRSLELAQGGHQLGKHAAAQIVNRVEGRPTQPFRYHDKGIMATIGRAGRHNPIPRWHDHQGEHWAGWRGSASTSSI